MRKTLFLALLLIVVAASGQSRNSERGVAPASGFVPDGPTAIKIAEAVLVPVYGEEKMTSERPFHAELSGDVWSVGGTIPCNMPADQPTTRVEARPGITFKKLPCLEGAAIVRISKTDGRVVFMTHTQ
jgi:NTF2 fold immunity protein